MIFESDIIKLNKLSKKELAEKLAILVWLVKNEMIGRKINEFTTMPLVDEALEKPELVIELDETLCVPNKPTKIFLKDT